MSEDLNYACNVDTRVLPLYLMRNRALLHPRVAVEFLEDAASEQGAPFRHPRLLLHIYRRLRRAQALWPKR